MAPCDLFNRAALRPKRRDKTNRATLTLHLFSKTAHVAYDAFHNADSAYQLPSNLWMSGDISPMIRPMIRPMMEKVGAKEDKNAKVSSFLLFTPSSLSL